MNLLTRRESLLVGLGSAMSLAAPGALAQQQKAAAPKQPSGPPMPPAEARLYRAIENAPWVASPGGSGDKVVYVLWAPWCPYCLQLMQDVEAGHYANFELRWIGSSARNESQKNLVAAIAKARDPQLLMAGVLRKQVNLPTPPAALADRIMSAELMFAPLKNLKGVRGYPSFIFYDGKQMATRSGYFAPASFITPADVAIFSTIKAPSTAYLDDPWQDLGPASGRPHQSTTEFTIYSLPSESAIPVNVVRTGYSWPSPLKRLIGVRNQKWASVTTGISFGNAPALDGYIRQA